MAFSSGITIALTARALGMLQFRSESSKVRTSSRGAEPARELAQWPCDAFWHAMESRGSVRTGALGITARRGALQVGPTCTAEEASSSYAARTRALRGHEECWCNYVLFICCNYNNNNDSV